MVSNGGERRSIRRQTARALEGAGNALARTGRRLGSTASADSLEGDRWVEWSFCMARLARGDGKTLDFGAGIGFLSLGAAQKGHYVVALDRETSSLRYSHERVEIVHSDILDHPLADRHFDQVINCSSVEHVGLPGRYGSNDVSEGDIEAMGILRDMLVPGGRMILTIPVGRDMVCSPLHRIYGEQRLPHLIEGFDLVEQQYWRKDRETGWNQAERAIALATEGSKSFYSLGLFVLAKPETG